MGKMLIFDWMLINTVVAHVEVNRETKEVTCQEFTDEIPYKFLGRRPKTIQSVLNKFRDRCFEEGRPDKEEILASMGLTQYNPFDIVKCTHGHTNRDDLWIRFEGEDLEYFRDINVLRPTLEQRKR